MRLSLQLPNTNDDKHAGFISTVFTIWPISLEPNQLPVMPDVSSIESPVDTNDQHKQPTVDNVDKNSIIVPDQFDERYRTTKWEIWAYYACVKNTLIVNTC